jgi:anthranilate 1,2-dioxygenase large subunit
MTTSSSGTTDTTELNEAWPRDDFSRVPYSVFTDADIYRIENERIFRGPVWNYLCHEIELPKSGDFVTTWSGDIHIIVARNSAGQVHAFENSCAHRGAKLTSAVRGNAAHLTCPYHLWTYTLEGNLQGVTFQRGVGGKGGMPACFEKKDHGLNKLRVAIYGGLVFGTFSEATPRLEEFLGPHSMAQIDRLLVQRKPKVLGYLRQRIPGNWKLYNENVRDPYHGSLLHQFQVSFGLQQPTMRGGIKLDADLKNTWNHSIITEQDAASQKIVADAYAGTGKFNPDLKMADPALTKVPLDLNDNYKTTILSMFPTLIVAQVDNTYAIRHLRPKGQDLVELHITYLGFESDTPAQTHDKLLTVNFIGPAGYISLEDGEALRLVQQGIRHRRPGGHEILEMGGVGPIIDTDYLSQEISIRGFWSFYHQIMGLPTPGKTERTV